MHAIHQFSSAALSPAGFTPVERMILHYELEKENQ